jgi:hypothetical protein
LVKGLYYLMAGPFFFITCRLLSYFKSSWSLGLGNECHCPKVVQYYNIFQGSIHLNNFLGFKQSYYGVYRFFKFTTLGNMRRLDYYCCLQLFFCAGISFLHGPSVK